MRTGRRSGTQTWTRRARRRAPRSGGSTPPARRADSERGSISSSPWSEARERVAVPTLIDGVGADQRAGRACAIHRVLVGNRIGVVLVEPEKRSEEHTSELQSLLRISFAVFCLQKHNNT